MYNVPMPANRFRTLRSNAIVLRHQDWGEADRLLWLFTLEHGKLRAIAKGVRKMRSRKAGHLEPFTHVSLLLAQGRDMPIITQAEAQEAFPALHENLDRLAQAAYVVELLDRFTYEEGENGALFRLLLETLHRLANNDDPSFAVHYYEMRLLDQVGFRPELLDCAVCGEEIQPRDQYFSAALGGAVCPRCGAGEPSARPISMAALRILRHLQRSSFAQARRLSISAQHNQEVEDLLAYYFTYLLERALNTSTFLRRLRRDDSL